MVASLKFESAAGTAAATLAEVKLVTLADNTDNKYTLDITTDDLKVAYTPNGGQAKEYIVDGLAAALGKLLTIDGSTAGKSVLAEEVAKKPVVEALIPELAKDDGINGIYTKKGVDDELAKKADTSAIPAAPDLSNYLETSKLAEEVVKKPVVDALIPELAKDDGINGIYTKKGVDDELAKKADTSAIPTAPDLSNYLETSKLAEEVVKKPVVEAIFNAQDLTDPTNPINVAETKIGATFAKKTDLDNKADANGTNLDDAKVTAILEKLTDKVVKTSELSAKAAAKPVVDAITASTDFTNKVYIKAASADEVYTKTAADAGFAKIDASNLTDAANQKAFAEAILPAKDGQNQS